MEHNTNKLPDVEKQKIVEMLRMTFDSIVVDFSHEIDETYSNSIKTKSPLNERYIEQLRCSIAYFGFAYRHGIDSFIKYLESDFSPSESELI